MSEATTATGGGEQRVFAAGDGLWVIDADLFGAPQNLSAYFLDGAEPTLVEPGPATCHDAVVAGLDALGVGPDDLAHIVVTHVHLDHAGGAGTLAARYPGADVIVHELGARHLVAPEKLIASATRIYGEDGMQRLWGEMRPVPADRLRTVDDGDVVELGGGRTLEIAYTPGHAKHHMSILDSTSGVVFVGDCGGLSFPGMATVVPIVPPPDIDAELLRANYARYRAMRPTGLGLAHFSVRTEVDADLDEVERRLDLWVSVAERHAADGTDAVAAALDAANAADLAACGRPEDEIELIQRRVNFTTEATGLLRYLEKRGGATVG